MTTTTSFDDLLTADTRTVQVKAQPEKPEPLPAADVLEQTGPIPTVLPTGVVARHMRAQHPNLWPALIAWAGAGIVLAAAAAVVLPQ